MLQTYLYGVTFSGSLSSENHLDEGYWYDTDKAKLTYFGAGSRSASGIESNYVEVDLGKTRPVSQVMIHWNSANARRFYRKVKVSVDGVKWVYVAGSNATYELSAAVQLGKKVSEDVVPVSLGYNIRYVRVYANGSSVDSFNSLYAVRVQKAYDAVDVASGSFAEFSDFERAFNLIKDVFHKYELSASKDLGWFAPKEFDSACPSKTDLEKFRAVVDNFYGEDQEWGEVVGNLRIDKNLVVDVEQKVAALSCAVCNACDAYTTCHCNVTCYNDLCSCDRECDSYSCACFSQCHGYEGCACDLECDVYDMVPVCTCDSICHVYAECVAESCGCYSRCYGYVACPSNSCSCNSTCHGNSPCACDGNLHVNPSCACNTTCHGYACTGYSGCVVAGYSRNCTCDARCHGYTSCGCDFTRYVTSDKCSCYNEAYGHSCGCNMTRYFKNCGCNSVKVYQPDLFGCAVANNSISGSVSSIGGCLMFSGGLCRIAADSMPVVPSYCTCDGAVFSLPCICDQSAYQLRCSCNEMLYSTECGCYSKCYGYLSSWTETGCSASVYVCSDYSKHVLDFDSNGSCESYSCPCYNQCYKYSPCSCNMICYTNSPCTCDLTCYGFSADCSCDSSSYGSGCNCFEEMYDNCYCYSRCDGYWSCWAYSSCPEDEATLCTEGYGCTCYNECHEYSHYCNSY